MIAILLFSLVFGNATRFGRVLNVLESLLREEERTARTASDDVCAPKRDANVHNAFGWLSSAHPETLTGMPSECSSTAQRATWAYGRYYEANKDNGGTCDFGDTAAMQSRSSVQYSACAYPIATPAPADPADMACAPKSGANISGALSWVLSSSGVSSNGMPFSCTSDEARATYMFSKYLDERESSGGDCDFGGAAEMQSLGSLTYPDCVYGQSSGPDPTPTPPSPPSGSGSTIKFMSYNLYGWNALGQNFNTQAHRIVEAINGVTPDILGAQETEGQAGWIAESTGLTKVPDDKHGLALFYQASKFRVLDHGRFNLNEMDKWGQRIVLWAKYQDKASGTEFYHFNSHWCLCGESLHVGTATTVAENMQRIAGNRNAVLTGDFNTAAMSNPPYPNAIRYLMGNFEDSSIHLRDVLGEMGATGATYPGQKRIDWMLAQGNLDIVEAHRQPGDDNGSGRTGSDHYYIEGTLNFQ